MPPTFTVRTCVTDDPVDVDLAGGTLIESLPADSYAPGTLVRVDTGVYRRVGRTADTAEWSEVTTHAGSFEIAGVGLPVPGVDGATRTELWSGYLTQADAIKEAMQLAARTNGTMEVQS